jgi:selenocysteine lyase/cysteine desulfurase
MKLRANSEFHSDLGLRPDFPLLVNNPGLHYLDSAATSQKPKVVLDALRDFYDTANANPHRGAYALSVRATECYHQSRLRVAQFLGVRDSDCLIFTRGTTEGLNLVAGAWHGECLQRRRDRSPAMIITRISSRGRCSRETRPEVQGVRAHPDGRSISISEWTVKAQRRSWRQSRV